MAESQLPDMRSYLASRTLGEVPEFDQLSESDLTKQAREQVSQLIDGQLPTSVSRQLRQRSAETAQLGGVFGPAARALELRDLGVSALDAIQTGVTFANQLEELRLNREQLNRTTTLERAKLAEEVRGANDRFALALTESNQNQQKIGLAALELQSRNRQFRIQMENELIIQNSVNAIDGVQQNVDSLATAFDRFNELAQQYVRQGI